MIRMAYELAQVNIARLVAPLDAPRLADFVAALDPVNASGGRRPRFRVAAADRRRQRHRSAGV